jgi:hypothetical protein
MIMTSERKRMPDFAAWKKPTFNPTVLLILQSIQASKGLIPEISTPLKMFS